MSKRYIADTNILIRLLTRDDDEQVHQLANLIDRGSIIFYMTSIVMIETFWVLKSAYKIEKESIVKALISIIESENTEMEEQEVMLNSLHTLGKVNVDVVDIYLSEKSRQSATPVLTWNKKDFKKLSCEFYSPDELL